MSFPPNVPPQTVMLRVRNSTYVNYCYLIIDASSRNAIAIDPAWDLNAIQHALQDHCATLRAIFVTHHHFDHFQLAGWLSITYDIPVFMSQPEAEFYNVTTHNITTFNKDTIIEIAGLNVEAFITPGHTKGSTCYKIGDNLFTGDTLFIEGCGLCNGRGASAQDMFESLARLKQVIPPHTRIYPGHRYSKQLGAPFSYLLNYNIYLCIQDETTFVQFRMRKNQRGVFNYI